MKEFINITMTEEESNTVKKMIHQYDDEKEKTSIFFDKLKTIQKESKGMYIPISNELQSFFLRSYFCLNKIVTNQHEKLWSYIKDKYPIIKEKINEGEGFAIKEEGNIVKIITKE